MQIGFIKESQEERIALLPENVASYKKLGYEVLIESGYGSSLNISDDEYSQQGVTIAEYKDVINAEIIAKINKPSLEDLENINSNSSLISFLNPFFESTLLEKLADKSVSAFSMEMVPRTTRAQKMDCLSSQANIAGYAAVMLAQSNLNQIFPMMMTAAGTIKPARVFVIGAGVAGLQAIATANRLGARVEAYDTRPEVEEQIKSLGAKFIKFNIGDTGSTSGGYAKKLTEEQIKSQQEQMKNVCAQSDVVITTAQVFGRKAPKIITEDMVKAMKPGSVVVDLAVDSGGNVEGVISGEITSINGVKVIGINNLPGIYNYDSSKMLANNYLNFIQEFTDAGSFTIDLKDEIISSTLITYQGEIVHERFIKQTQGA